jgi:hypothetical protein
VIARLAKVRAPKKWAAQFESRARKLAHFLSGAAESGNVELCGLFRLLALQALARRLRQQSERLYFAGLSALQTCLPPHRFDDTPRRKRLESQQSLV